jgi:hypothetical protein
MYRLNVPGGCAQSLEVPFPTDKEDELLTSESVLAVGGSLLPIEPNVNKFLMEN